MFKQITQKYKNTKNAGEEDFSNLSLRQITGYFTVNSSIYVLVTFLQEALTFFLLPLYMAKLSSSEYGTLELIIICSGIITICMALELYNIVSRCYFKWQDEGILGESIFTIWIFCLLFSITLSLILHLYGPVILSIFFEKLSIVYFDYAILLGFLSAQQLIPRALMRIKGELTLYSITNICGFLVGLMANLYLILVAGQGLKGALVGQLTIAGILALGYTAYALRYMKPILRVNCIHESLRFSLPMVPGAFGNTLSVTLDRIVLGNIMTMDALGIYSYARKIGHIMQVVAQIVKNAWIPFCIRLIEQRPKDYTKILPLFSDAYGLVMLVLSLGLSIFSKELLFVLGGDKYLSIASIIPVFVVGGFFYSMYFVFSYGILMSDKTHFYSIAVASSLVTSVAGNLLLIPSLGLYGGALAYVLSYFVWTGTTIYFSKKYFSIPFHYNRLIMMLVSALMLGFLGYLFDLYILSMVATICLKVLLVLIFLVCWGLVLFEKRDYLRDFMEGIV